MNFMTGQDQDESAATQDLHAALEQGETAFVTESTKKQVSAGTVGMLGILAMCAAGTYFMYVRGGPKQANAADAGTAQTINSFLADGDKHVTLMKQMLRDTDKVVLRFRQSTAQSQVPLERLQTNPFLMELTSTVPAAGDNSASRRRREEERAAAFAAVKTIKLQSVLYGTQRAALMNNKLVQEGAEIDGFTVERISPDSVIVRSGVYRFELKMQR